jgi:glycine cleavage system T protein (aminomethyltransferase)
MTEPKHTPLTEWHRAHGGKLVEFAGYEMPMRYEGVIAEHHRVRRQCGIFDVSHMGELEVRGTDARASVHHLVTNDIQSLESGQVIYTAMCNEGGGVLDDLLIYCLSDDHFIIVCNAANHAKVASWVAARLDGDARMKDETENTALFALQGPESRKLLERWPRLASQIDRLRELEYYRASYLDLDGVKVLLSRTGYTGELGYELYLPTEFAVELWQELMECGSDCGIAPIGLGARDTLRLEAGYSLYGHELDESTLPYEGGIGWVVRPKAGDFVGRESLLHAKESGIERRTVALELEGRNIPRENAAVLADGETVGHITSGSFSPSLERGIGLARIRSTALDCTLLVDIRGKQVPAERVKLPFVPSHVRG